MNITINGVEINPINKESDRYAVGVKITCNDCKSSYFVGEEDKKKCDEFLESIVQNKPTKYIGCPYCNKSLN